ncbi:MAG: rhomboid family intramembrane serine protease [Shimia sp.]
MDPYTARPVNTLPWSVLLLVGAILAVELVLWAAGEGLVGGPLGPSWRVFLIEDVAFSDPIFEWMLANGAAPWEHVLRFVGYAFVHLGMIHAVFACVFILALGKFVGEAMGPVAVLVIFFAAVVGGAAIYSLAVDSGAPLIGAYPGAYGLIGAFTYLMLIVNEARGERQLLAFRLLGVLMAIQLGFALLFGGPPTWVADLGGALIGFLVAFAITPGALLGMIRRD